MPIATTFFSCLPVTPVHSPLRTCTHTVSTGHDESARRVEFERHGPAPHELFCRLQPHSATPASRDADTAILCMIMLLQRCTGVDRNACTRSHTFSEKLLILSSTSHTSGTTSLPSTTIFCRDAVHSMERVQRVST